MKEWLKMLFHPHKWVVRQRVDLVRGGYKVGDRYTQQCSICGKLKQKDIR